MKRTFLAVILCAGSLSLMADDYQYLTIAHKSGENQIELASIQKITFETTAGNVVVTTTEGEVRFPISEMEKMYFSATPSAIEALPLKSDALKMHNGQLKVSGKGLLRIYSSNGALQRMAKIEGESTISLDNLSKGTYIVNMGSQTIKIQK